VSRVDDIFEAAIAAHTATLVHSRAEIERAASLVTSALVSQNRLLVFGNGGSAADAQHLASELVNRFQKNRRALAAVALTADSSVLTSIANDTSYDRVFARQIEALGHAGDVALGITTSGRSANVVAALEQARAQRLTTIAMNRSGHVERVVVRRRVRRGSSHSHRPHSGSPAHDLARAV
jgi:D-sedoheptulose 7-phosphate isomerase